MTLKKSVDDRPTIALDQTICISYISMKGNRPIDTGSLVVILQSLDSGLDWRVVNKSASFIKGGKVNVSRGKNATIYCKSATENLERMTRFGQNQQYLMFPEEATKRIEERCCRQDFDKDV